MNAEQFLQIADDKGFLNAKQLAKIRQQVQSSEKPISAGRIAKVLVDKGLITKHEAKSLLDDLQVPAQEKENAAAAEAGPTIKKASVEESSLDLAPIDEDEKQPAAADPVPLDASELKPNQPPVVDLESLDEAPELELFEVPAANEPVAKVAELVELDNQSTSILPVPGAPPTAPPPASHVPADETGADALDEDHTTSDGGQRRCGRDANGHYWAS